ncbi:RsfA family transcriptional regulator [Calidifontibacillus erzurumensis]|uniref:RsfA family transcriptional regulator n=1 Tax=Calidifontibacillus erzurumensis TaxID=2741433 RepID=A0A8J8K7I0_9BACI|nr:RsfA family transcriptional regulator [Calidifontibacillus erzurumensis]NSL50766.1 RsfA family transcriptional regulator [Calidifontibacillus erzurumensis]
MSTIRQDAWTEDEDLLLAEVVLRHIREGSTQLAAFDEVGKKLSRTAAACGFRWNSTIRKQYKSAIELAKKQRKGEVQDRPLNEVSTGNDERKNIFEKENNDHNQANIQGITFEGVISFLSSLESTIKNVENLKLENEKLKSQINALQEEKNELLGKIDKLTENYNLIEEDYKALIEIMERARKMVVLQDEGTKFKFQMDKNGNLERIQK